VRRPGSGNAEKQSHKIQTEPCVSAAVVTRAVGSEAGPKYDCAPIWCLVSLWRFFFFVRSWSREVGRAGKAAISSPKRLQDFLPGRLRRAGSVLPRSRARCCSARHAARPAAERRRSFPALTDVFVLGAQRRDYGVMGAAAGRGNGLRQEHGVEGSVRRASPSRPAAAVRVRGRILPR